MKKVILTVCIVLFISESIIFAKQPSFIRLGYMPGSTINSYANAVSADGSVVVGSSSSHEPSGFSFYQFEAFRWTATDGMQPLGFLNDNYLQSVATAVSGNGQVIIGNSVVYQEIGYAYRNPFRWTSDNGLIDMGSLPGKTGGIASALSYDGSVIVGCAGNEAFRWTADKGMVGLGGEYSSSAAEAVSADGSVIVGCADDEPFIWDSEKGMRILKNVLTQDYGLDLDGFILDKATAISADGSTIVGYGHHPNGKYEAYVATVPEPTTLLLFGLGAVMLRRKKRARSKFD